MSKDVKDLKDFCPNGVLLPKAGFSQFLLFFSVFERPLCSKFVKDFGLAQRRRERRVSQRKGGQGERERESTLGAEAAELLWAVCEALR